MNIAEASYRVGMALRKSKHGNELVEFYREIEKSISVDSWDLFHQKRAVMMHYFAFPNSFAIINGNYQRDDLPEYIHKMLEELVNNSIVREFCDKCVSFGREMEQTLLSILVPNKIPRSFGNFETQAPLRRAIQDLHVTMQRSGITQKMLLYVDKYGGLNKKMSDFESKIDKSHIPFHKVRRTLINELSSSGNDYRMLVLMDSFVSTMQVIRQIICETHLGMISELGVDESTYYRYRVCDMIIPFRLHLNNSPKFMSNYGTFAHIREGAKDNFALITKINIRFGRDVPEGIRTKIVGYLYPENDVNILNKTTIFG
jgi:hypothetical protein